MQNIFITRAFEKTISKASINSNTLLKAVDEIKLGLVDADLGGNLIKKRIAISGGGKRGGFRTVIATKHGHHYFFIYGFKKNEKSNISPVEMNVLQTLALELLALDEAQLGIAIQDGTIKEIKYEQSKN
jgi:hypothetical protein